MFGLLLECQRSLKDNIGKAQSRYPIKKFEIVTFRMNAGRPLTLLNWSEIIIFVAFTKFRGIIVT